MSPEDFKRILFRLNWLIDSFKFRREVLKNGNLASLEPEIMLLNQNMEDLTDVIKELVTLLSYQKEQGLISPPKEQASSSDTPER